jgi:hypothetical protein
MIRQKAAKALKSSKFRARPYYPTVADCHLWTALINHLIFGGTAPKYRKVTIKRLSGAFAHCIGLEGTKGQLYCKLEIHDRFPSFLTFYSVLLHELTHLKEWTEHGTMAHGKFFRSHKELAANIGVTLALRHPRD